MSNDQIITLIKIAIPLVFIATVWLLHKWVLRMFGVVLIPMDKMGLVNKKYVVTGRQRSLPDGAIVALNGEAGWQADTLAPGVHYGYWPWQYAVEIVSFTKIPDVSVGVVESRDGQPLKAGRVLAKHIECNAFQDARAFLMGGGERGPQITIIPPGTYRINTALFQVSMEPQYDVPDNMVGVVTTREGQALRTGDIAGKEIAGHNSFQDGQAFLDHGGSKGLQEQVILAGRYFINPLFAEITTKEMYQVPIAHVGVVIAYVGEEGKDVSGDTFKHGNLVGRGQKGVWATAFDPGKYPINPFTHKVENVPTANVVLNWATGKSESHNLDKNLSTITARSADGFKFNLDVSQIIHIPGRDAPMVIARFGTVLNLVSQVLEPTIGNYFRNSAQGTDVIDFLKNRQQRQADARAQIANALLEYNVIGVDTLIGDIVPPEDLMKTLTDRKLAEQQLVTFGTQKLSEDGRKELEQAKAVAATQASVVAAQRQVDIATFNANSAAAKAEGEKRAMITTAEGTSSAVKLNADADAYGKEAIGKAEATAIKATGTAEAEVVKLKIASMDAGNFTGIEVAKALSKIEGLKLVPEIMVSGGAGGDTGSLLTAFLASMFRHNGTAPASTGVTIFGTEEKT